MPAEAVSKDSKPGQEYFVVPDLPKVLPLSPELERMRAEAEAAKANDQPLKWHSHLRERVVSVNTSQTTV